MFISDHHRFVFVHVQKTGGVTAETRLVELMPEGVTDTEVDGVQRHSPLEAFLQKYPEKHSYFVFGVVRNPWSRMLSWWRMLERFRDNAANGVPWAVKRLESNKFWNDLVHTCPDFESFVLEAPKRHVRLRRPQVEFISTEHRMPDFVGRQESLEADIRAIAARFDLPWTPLDRRNVDPRPPDSYREFYTDEMRDAVGSSFARDIELFGYDW